MEWLMWLNLLPVALLAPAFLTGFAQGWRSYPWHLPPAQVVKRPECAQLWWWKPDLADLSAEDVLWMQRQSYLFEDYLPVIWSQR